MSNDIDFVEIGSKKLQKTQKNKISMDLNLKKFNLCFAVPIFRFPVIFGIGIPFSDFQNWKSSPSMICTFSLSLPSNRCTAVFWFLFVCTSNSIYVFSCLTTRKSCGDFFINVRRDRRNARTGY